MGYLSVKSSEPQKVVDAFLKKIGKTSPRQPSSKKAPTSRTHIPKLNKSHTDREKNAFLRNAFEEIVFTVEQFAKEIHTEQPHFDYEMEQITSRKVLFTFYSNDEL